MTMPMMPGLTGAEGEEKTNDDMGGGGGDGENLESILEELDGDTVAQLAAEADEAYVNGELDEYMNALPSEENSDPAAASEPPPAEGDDAVSADPAAAPTPDPMVAADTAAAIVEEIAGYENELGELLAAADDSEEGDAKPIQDALDVVVEALDEAESAKEDAEKAADAEDPDAVSEALAAAEGAVTKAKEAVAKAKEAAMGQVAEKQAENEPSALEAWAEKNS